jgi:hypothetical protein
MSTTFIAHVYRNRTRDFTVPITEADGSTPVELAEADVVRLKIGTNGTVPLLDLSSIEETVNHSSIVFTPGSGTCTVRLAQADIEAICAAAPGQMAFDCELDVVDASETAPVDAIKLAEIGVVFIHPTQTGEIGDEESSQSQESSDSSSVNSSESSSS